MAEPVTSLAAQQRALARSLRCPTRSAAPPGAEPRRLAMLQQMVFNDFSLLLGENFPRCVDLLGTGHWHTLVRHYFASHRCRSPLFPEVPAEFMQWLKVQPALPHPALGDLAHYEWAQRALQALEAAPLPEANVPRHVMDVPLRCSPLAWIVHYRWPVHVTARPLAVEGPAEPIHLLLQRDDEGYVVRCELGSWAAGLLLDIAGTPGLRGRDYVQRLAEREQQPLASLSPALQPLLEQACVQRTLGPVPSA